MRGKIKKIVSNHNNLRTTEMEGEFSEPPTVGQPFTIFGEALEEKEGVRMIRTTPVKEVGLITGGDLVFKTENSEYELEIHPE